MSKNIKIIIGVVIVVLVLLGLNMNRGEKGGKVGKESIKLGLMLPLTGDLAAAGQNIQRGMTVAIEEFKKNNPNLNIEVVVEDDAYDTKKGIAAYNKLTNLDNIDILLMISTPVIDAIYQDVNKKDIPVIQLGVQTAGVADDKIIQFSPAAEAPIGHLAKYLSEDKDFYSKKVAVLYDNTVAQLSFFNAFKSIYKHDFTSFVVNDKNDLRIIATKIAQGNYGGVVIIESPINGAIFTKELLTIDKTMPTLVYDAQLQTGFVDYTKILGDTNKINGARSMWFKSGRMDEITKLYKTKYGEDPGFLVDFSYDMINTALATYDKNSKSWLNNLKKFSDPNGASGSISFDSNGIRIQPMVITEVKNGKISPIGKLGE